MALICILFSQLDCFLLLAHLTPDIGLNVYAGIIITDYGCPNDWYR